MVPQTGQYERETCHIRGASMKSAVYWVHATARIHLSRGAITRSPPSRCDLWICREESSRIFGSYCGFHECIVESDEREYIKGLNSPCVKCSFRSSVERSYERVPEFVDDDGRSKR